MIENKTNIDNQQNNSMVNFLKYPLVKEIFLSLLLIIFSGSVISYFLSKLFIERYLSGIGYNTLIYHSLIDNSTISSFIFGIAVITISFLFTLIIPSPILRHLYHEKIDLFLDFHNKYKIIIDIYLVFCLFIQMLLLIILLYLKQNVYWYFLSCIFPLILFVFIGKNIEKMKRIQIVETALWFSVLITLSFFPILLILKALINVFSEDDKIIFTMIFSWLIYSILYGFRITNNRPFQYFIDVIFSFIFLYFIMVYSSHTIKNPIAEFIGLKDKNSYVYAISEKDFAEIKNNLNTHWYYYQDSKDNKDNVLLYVKRKSDNQFYLNTQIIFRNDKIVVLCPPDYKIVQQKPEVCFIAKQQYLMPTTLTETNLRNTSLFSEIKEVAKYQYEISDTEKEK